MNQKTRDLWIQSFNTIKYILYTEIKITPILPHLIMVLFGRNNNYFTCIRVIILACPIDHKIEVGTI